MAFSHWNVKSCLNYVAMKSSSYSMCSVHQWSWFMNDWMTSQGRRKVRKSGGVSISVAGIIYPLHPNWNRDSIYGKIWGWRPLSFWPPPVPMALQVSCSDVWQLIPKLQYVIFTKDFFFFRIDKWGSEKYIYLHFVCIQCVKCALIRDFSIW